MIKPIKNILFATNLTKDCLPAFYFAAGIATRYQATIVLLHVMEKMPEYVEGRLKGMLGERKWREIIDSQLSNARQTLIGKVVPNSVVKAALTQFCDDTGIDDQACGYQAREIVVTDGDTVDDIIETAEQYECDMIVLGAPKGYFSRSSVGPVIRGVMKRAGMPVTVVPRVDGDEISE